MGLKKYPNKKVPHKCLSIIILDSLLYACEKYYPKIFLEESNNDIELGLECNSDSDSDNEK